MGRVSRWLSLVLAWVVGDVLRVRRAHVEAAMERAGIPDPEGTARAMYRELGRALLELLSLAYRPRAALDVRLEDEMLARLCERGAVIATAHTGGWDTVACAVARRVPLTVVTKRLSVGVLDRVWQGIRLARGVRLSVVGGAARDVLGALSRREVVAMLVDQAPERTRGVARAPFLGAEALIDLAPALCALRARVPLVAAFPMRLPDGTLSVHVAGVLPPPAVPSRLWAERATLQVTAWLEEFVRRNPEQWLWMHRRWKGASAGRVSACAASRGEVSGFT